MKKFLSLVVVLAMLMGLSAVTFAAGTTTVYCVAPSGWSNCNVYWWNSATACNWPGNAMSKDANGIWYYEVPSDATNVIFNNGSAQSADLAMPTGVNVQYDYVGKTWGPYGGETEELTLVNVYVDIATMGFGSNVNAYIWDCASGNSWPGVSMTLVEGTIYSLEVWSDTRNIIFNDGINQTADLIFPNDSNNMWNGSEWVPYVPAAPEAPTYELVAGVKQSISIPVGGYANVVVDASSSEMVLTVNGNRSYYDWYVQGGMMPSYPGPNGAVEIQLSAGGIHTIPVYNISEDAVQVLDVTAAAPAVGTMENPDTLILGNNVAEVQPGGQGYFYNWIAAEDGKLTIAIDTALSGNWVYCINVLGEISLYGDSHYCDDNPVVTSQTVSVKAGDKVEVVVSSAVFGAETVVFNASFEAGTESGGEQTTPGASKDTAIDITNSPWHYIEAGATVWFLYDDSTDALLNGILSQLVSIHSSTNYTAEYLGQALAVDGDGYVNSELVSDGSGKYYIVITNNGDEKAFFSISLEDKPAYVNTYEYVYVGQNVLTLDTSAEYTLWEFEPTETGVYKFTVSAGFVSNWGTAWYPQNQTENATTTIEWTCTGVGQSIMVGISGVSNAVLTIELKGEYVVEEMEWTEYENTELKSDYVVNGELTAIDVTDDIADVVWFCEDGFVRYGSKYGPIVVADLSDCLVNFVEAATNGQLRFYVYQGDILVSKIDVNNAMMEYVEAGITPMTEELSFMLIMLGQKNGWYDPSIPGFYLWSDEEGDIAVNPDEAWLFPCYIVEGTELTPEDDNEEEVILSDYIVAGNSGLCGSEWDPADPSNKMVDNGDGTYSITFKNVAVGSYEFKIAKGSWAENWGVGGANGGNVTVKVESVCDVTITFVAETCEIIVNNEQIPETGDDGMNVMLIVLVLATMGMAAIVCTKKKFF